LLRRAFTLTIPSFHSFSFFIAASTTTTTYSSVILMTLRSQTAPNSLPYEMSAELQKILKLKMYAYIPMMGSRQSDGSRSSDARVIFWASSQRLILHLLAQTYLRTCSP
jgi:hypothetical protein